MASRVWLVSPPGWAHLVRPVMGTAQHISSTHQVSRPAYVMDVLDPTRRYKKQETEGWQLLSSVAFLLYEPLGVVVAVVGNSHDWLRLAHDGKLAGIPPEAQPALLLLKNEDDFSRVVAGDVARRGWKLVGAAHAPRRSGNVSHELHGTAYCSSVFTLYYTCTS